MTSNLSKSRFYKKAERRKKNLAARDDVDNI